eukprot:GHVO01054401.1.p1 GENE.GHVO01054401.1~~GHVO01054401.1.p1  ORF type:complete len:290 (+),score=-23.50 GHVO01054401.1:74-871(+)
MTNNFNKDLVSLSSYLKCNRLSLNLSKTHSMLFSLDNSLHELPLFLSLDGSIIIDTVKTTSFLGVKIDNKLTFADHIKHISNKVSKSIGVLYKVSKVVNRQTLHMLYNSLVLPYLTYCIVVWGNAADVHIERLFRLQKKALRIICNAPYLAHTAPLFFYCSLLKVRDLYTYQTSIFTFKLSHHMLPAPVARTFPLSPLVHGQRTRNQTSLKIHVPFSRTKLRQRSLNFNIPTIYNSILQPFSLLELSSLNKFKTSMKSILLATYV